MLFWFPRNSIPKSAAEYTPEQVKKISRMNVNSYILHKTLILEMKLELLRRQEGKVCISSLKMGWAMSREFPVPAVEAKSRSLLCTLILRAHSTESFDSKFIDTYPS